SSAEGAYRWLSSAEGAYRWLSSAEGAYRNQAGQWFRYAASRLLNQRNAVSIRRFAATQPAE
ncbi:MAG TPA: hypothetical protein PLU61_09535, partial [Rhodoglobus sp.]|nr:hypothetical protein [Rhodoglobus sp.]